MKDLNFFRPYLGQNKEKINYQIYVYGMMIIVGLAIAISFGINTTKMMFLDKSISEYNEKLSAPDIQSQLKEAETVNKQIDILKKYDKALNDVAISVKGRNNVSEELLKDISSTLPNEVLFKSLDVVENNIAIKGTSTSREAVAELERKLRELPIMSDVYVNSINVQSSVEGEFSFDIKCVLKDVG
ncbi:PilN domain-containing protein [Clostridium beijerinckii]|uniref:Type IV pilus assembly protein PilN n=1 Tax=Clostridium beijerinckii TaxID=1520 RepID=A0A9Q5CYD3_CLOBE|nr:PilN domain-containing protein [Clostridium beijerinckii]AQS07072.1 fimbrial assembly protein PilN [Clostridium beijerinckii]MBA2883568.1 type IV pilus assembly protein PilN [Clostridium beijerinckii]MBA2898755.1 type IV pilus assembly protein PilN [Clostridium beijerinckii]MBA2908155.1 type IV pilus assembly protein PilN [Clostridium beijerinckii]MBA9013297.1 type IV pilus assembly protein PilN [Clostridium beijerinckii]